MKKYFNASLFLLFTSSVFMTLFENIEEIGNIKVKPNA